MDEMYLEAFTSRRTWRWEQPSTCSQGAPSLLKVGDLVQLVFVLFNIRFGASSQILPRQRIKTTDCWVWHRQQKAARLFGSSVTPTPQSTPPVATS